MDEFGAKSIFIGYESTSSDVFNVLVIVCGGEFVEEVLEGVKVDIVLDVMLFYVESGG